ncbi:MAG: NAD-dependent epimerase/dehydratase family protein [Pseudomonadota bacterium]
MGFVLDSDCAEVANHLGELAHGFGGKTLVLTGAGGFLGQYVRGVAHYLNEYVLNDPLSVIALDNFIVGEENADDKGTNHYTFRQHNVIEPIDIDGRVDFVVHAAGIASPYHYRAYPLETLEVATTGTKHMLSLAREKNARLLFFSSSEIYGDPDPQHVPTPESYRGNVSCQGPRACYDESKRLGETLLYVYNTYYGVSCNSVRPFNVYGPGMRENDYRVLPNFASRIKAGKPLNVYGSGQQTRTYCYVTDAMVGFLRILLRGVPGETYNIGNPEPEISVIELADRISSVLGRDIERNLIEYPDSYPADEPNRRCPDIRKARLQLGYEPQIPIETGLKRFFEWADGQYVGSV